MGWIFWDAVMIAFNAWLIENEKTGLKWLWAVFLIFWIVSFLFDTFELFIGAK